jgi:hypothetical protein
MTTGKRTFNYFELKRGKHYACSLDDSAFKGKFVYRLHRHYLVYRLKDGEWDYDKGRVSFAWRGVWNANRYDDTQAFYREVPKARKGGKRR